MADTNKKFLDLTGLQTYDGKIKEVISAGDAATLASAKSYADGLADNYDAAGTAQTKVDALANGQVKTNKEAIDVLNGADTVEGSVAKQIKDAKTAIEAEITASEYDDTALKARVSANETAISTLNGTGAGSVKKQIDDAFNDFATKVSDDSVVNTYKELIDYCSTHSSEAAEMAGDISKNNAAIATLETFVGKLPEGTSAKTVIDYINAKVTAVDFSDAIATAKSEAISTAASDATTKANKALDDAKTYADGLAGNYATAAQGTKADSALQKADIAEGATNGSIAVKGTDVKVHGLGTAAYAATSAFDAAGAADTVQTALNTYKTSNDAAVKANADDIDALETKVTNLESVTYVEITNAEINALFA